MITANGGIADTDSVAAVDENGYASPISQQDLDAAINYKQGLCGTRLAKRQCDPTVATNAEVAWLARQLQGGGVSFCVHFDKFFLKFSPLTVQYFVSPTECSRLHCRLDRPFASR